MPATPGGRLGQRWVSPFSPTNSADEHRFDDVTLAASAQQRNGGLGRGFGGGGGAAGLKSPSAEEAEGELRLRGSGARLSFGDADSIDGGGSEFEVATPGGRVVFSRAPKGPWQGPRPSTAAFDRVDWGGRMGRQQQTAVLHRMAHTRPLLPATTSSAASPLSSPPSSSAPRWPPPPTLASMGAEASAGSGRKSSGFSLRRLFHIGARRSRSRSRSSATPTPLSSRSRAPSGGVGAGVNGSSGSATEPRIGHPAVRSNSTLNGFAGGVNGGGGGLHWRTPRDPHSGGAASVVRSSSFSAEIVLARERRHPAPDYHHERATATAKRF